LAHWPRAGIWNEFAIELTLLERQIVDSQKPKELTAKMRLILEADLAQVIPAARDQARTRIFALSHWIGIAAEPVVILPILAAIAAGGISALFYYGRSTGLLSGAGMGRISPESRRRKAWLSSRSTARPPQSSRSRPI
jgi:hypothetical protein